MNDSSREQRLEEVLAYYLQQLETGTPPDQEQLLAVNPDLAADLQSFFRESEKMQHFARQQQADTLAALPIAPLGTRLRYFGDYELLDEIARGGMGVVFKARQVSLNRVVALKMILRGELATPADVQRFRTEAEAAARLDHPNIVPIYEIGEHDGQHYFTMKLIERRSASFAEQLHSGSAAAKMLARVARAVHHAHQRGILHRDLKPGNILIDAAGEPHVTDFGLAKRMNEAASNATRSGAVVGTPSYMAPEQARADKSLTIAVDVYSLGAVLYEALTGRAPFRGDDPLSTLRRVIEDEPVRPRSLDPRIDADLETICLKCLEKDPQRRYGSAEALAEDLERWLAGKPIHARRVSSAERCWRWCRRNPAVAAASALAVFALTATIVVTVAASIRESEHSAAVARQQLASARQKHKQDLEIQRQKSEHDKRERDKDRERLRESLIDQARLQRAAGARQRSLESIRKAADIRRDDALRLEACMTVTRPEIRLLHDMPNRQRDSHYQRFSNAPNVSADGRLVAFLPRVGTSQGEAIEVREIATSRVLGSWNWTGRSSQYYPVAFRAGTTQLALVKPWGKLTLWDFVTNQEVARFEDEKLIDAAFSTDGSRLLLMYINKRQEPMRVVNLDDMSLAKAPRPGELQAFLSGHELVFLDKERYHVWDCVTGQESLTPDGLQAVSFSAPARLAALRGRHGGDMDEALHIWDLAAGKWLFKITGLRELPKRVDFSPDRRYLAIDDPADEGKAIRIWNVILGQFTHRLFPPRGFTLATNLYKSNGQAQFETRSFNPDGSLLAAGMAGFDRQCIWDTATGEVATVLRNVRGHHWSNDGQLLITDEDVHCWKVTRPPATFELGKPVQSLRLHPSGERLAVNEFVCTLAAGLHGPNLTQWTGMADGVLAQFVGKDEVWGVYATKDAAGKSKYAAGRPDVALLGGSIMGMLGSPAGAGPLHAHCAICPRSFELFPRRTHHTELRQLAPRQAKLVVPSVAYPEILKKTSESESKEWRETKFCQMDSTETSTGEFAPQTPYFLRSGHFHFYHVVQAWDDGYHTNYFSCDVVELWNYDKGTHHSIPVFWPKGLQFSPDGRRFALARTLNQQADLSLWNTETCHVEKSFAMSVERLAFSPDGRRLLVIRWLNGYVADLIDVDTGREVQRWPVKNGEWQAFAISPDGMQVASGDKGSMIHLWDVANGRELARWPAHDASVTALLFSKDGRTLFSGGQDGMLTLWNLPAIRQELRELELDW